MERVLVLHSYHKGYDWTDSMETAIEEILLPRGVELYVEYMDTQRNLTERTFELLAEVYQDRYLDTGIRFDAIIATDDPALAFLLRFRDEIFPGTPVVFNGINNLDPQRIPVRAGYTGVNEAIDIPGTLELALQLRPETDRVFVISDRSFTGEINKEIFDGIRGAFEDRVTFRELYDLPAASLYQILREEVHPTDAILYLSYFIAPDGERLTAMESLSQISAAAAAPVYTLWDFFAHTGALGGVVVSGDVQGRTAANMVVQILEGKNPGDIPLVMESPNITMLDYRVLRRHGIPTGNVPRRALIIGRDRSPLQQYWWVLAALLGFILLEAVLIGALLASRRRRKAIQWELESITRNSPDIIVRLDRQLQYRFVNPALERITGISGELPIPPDVLPRWNTATRIVLGSGESATITYSLTTPEGRKVTLESRLLPETDDSGVVQSILVISRDVTAAEQARVSLARSLQEKEVLLKEIHHRVKNNLQIVASLINLTAHNSSIDTTPLLEVQDRVVAMAQIHEQLYRSGDFAALNVADYAREMIMHLVQAYSSAGTHPRVELDLENALLQLDQAVPFGLLLTEVITNTLKHAWRGTPEPPVPPVLWVSLRNREGSPTSPLILIVEDNGRGLPPDFDPAAATSTGVTLVRALTDQMRGTIAMETVGQTSGTRITLEIPCR